MKEEGKDDTPNRRSLKITSKGIAVTMFDPLLEEKNWQQIHDGLSILLLCCYQNKVGAELMGTLFDIKKKKRFASVVIAKGDPRANGEISES